MSSDTETQSYTLDTNLPVGCGCSAAYVGGNNPVKRLDLLFSALSSLTDLSWELHIIGLTEDKAHQVWSLPSLPSEQVIWHGSLPNEDVKAKLQQMDLLVLPSQSEGWGGVVNEALQSGCRALVSQAVGAKDLISRGSSDEPKRGDIFRLNDVQDLKHKLHAQIEKGPVTIDERQTISQWAQDHIAPEIGARYFCDIINYTLGNTSVRPKVPWSSSIED